MSITLKTIATIGFGLVFAVVSTPVVMAQQARETVHEGPAVIKYNGDMANMLAQLPSIYNRTIGLEVDSRQPRSTVGFYLKHPSLADVLNAITQSAPIYQWSEKDDFVAVVPLGGGSPFLDTQISNFRVDYADETEAIVQLMNLPEVLASMSAMKLRHRDPLHPAPIGGSKKMSFSLHNVTLRQVLNKIADENGSRFWIFRRNSSGFFSITTQPVNH